MTPVRQRMLEDMQLRNLSPHTQRAHVENVARFARHFGRSPADLGPEEIRTYQVHDLRQGAREDRHDDLSSVGTEGNADADLARAPRHRERHHRVDSRVYLACK